MSVTHYLLAGAIAIAWAAPAAAQEQVGRYTIVTNGGEAFLLDTAHGLIWQRVQFGGMNVWQFMFRLDNAEHTENFVKNVLPNWKKRLPTKLPTTEGQ